VLRDQLHGNRADWLPKLLPVVLPGHRIEEIPYFLQPYTADHYLVAEISATGIEAILRVILAKPLRLRPARGPIPELPPLSDNATVSLSPPAEAWVALSEQPSTSWRGDLLDVRGWQQAPVLELHLVPVGDHERLQVRRLAGLARELAVLGREHGLFDFAAALDVDSSDHSAWALAADPVRNPSGITVLRAGQRSAWAPLPHGVIGYVLIHDEVVRWLTESIRMLLSPDLVVPTRVAVDVALEPVNGARIGTRADLTSSHAGMHMTYPQHIRIPAEEAYTPYHLREATTDVAEELATRLVASFRRQCR
jgi:hypothetical protein